MASAAALVSGPAQFGSAGPRASFAARTWRKSSLSLPLLGPVGFDSCAAAVVEGRIWRCCVSAAGEAAGVWHGKNTNVLPKEEIRDGGEPIFDLPNGTHTLASRTIRAT